MSQLQRPLMSIRWKQLLVASSALLATACSTVGQIENEPLTRTVHNEIPSILFASETIPEPQEVTLILAFSGGGTRASALSYGVLEELRDTMITVDGKPVRLLDEVDFISSVSGGSITAAYYGLFREQLFEDFKQDFLTRNLRDEILATLFNPIRWFSTLGITDHATQIYAQAGFGDHTFADMFANGPPYVAINATDLSQGTRFSFVQDYFNLLCSDISTFPVARAVAASAAMPIVFDPVVLKNYDTCDVSEAIDFLAKQSEKGRKGLRTSAFGALSYTDKEARPYVHLVDGGVSDNLGLRVISEPIELTGGLINYLKLKHGDDNFAVPGHFVIISVDASVKANDAIDTTSAPPSVTQVVNAVTDTQIHLYNEASIELLKQRLEEWSEETKDAQRPIQTHFVEVQIDAVASTPIKRRLNLIPTTLGLPEKEVDLLIEAGRNLLRENPEFQELLGSLALSNL